jgi:hypothetical protein
LRTIRRTQEGGFTVSLKVEIFYGPSAGLAKSTSIILGVDLPQGQPPTEDRVACVDGPVVAADVAVDLAYAWTGVCSLSGYNIFSADSKLYEGGPDDGYTEESEDFTYDYGATSGEDITGVSNQFLALQSFNGLGGFSALRFWYPGSISVALGDRTPMAGITTGNLFRLKQFYTLYNTVLRECVTVLAPGTTERTFAPLGKFRGTIYHGVRNG